MDHRSSCLGGIVDLQRYPLHELTSERGAELVERCHGSLTKTGVCQLDGFLLPDAIDSALEAASRLIDQAWTSDQCHNVYFEPVPADPLPEDPLGMMQHSAKRAIAYDLLPPDLPLRVLYETPEMTAFVASALGRSQLYRSADELDALEIAVFAPGDELGWHFDNSEFSVTMMLQSAAVGGFFDYVRGLRTSDHPNADGVSAFLRGVAPVTPIRLDPPPGTLSLFQGHGALACD